MAVQHTVVPYQWRRLLAFFRSLLAITCLAVYLVYPVPGSLWILLAAGIYTIYSLLLLIRDSLESSTYPVSVLFVDLTFFVVCVLHRGQPSVWLGTLCFFYLLAFATLLYEWRFVVTVATAACILMVAVAPISAVLWPGVVLSGLFAVLMAAQKENMQNRLSAALKRSVLSRSEAEMARQSERQRIAADFHDGPLQSFISFQMRLEIIRKMLTRDTEAGVRELIQLQDLGRAQVTELRAFVRDMQPAEVKPSNLQAVIRETVEHFERDSGITADFVCGDLSFIDDDTAAELLQVVREGLNNVRKHSKASCVSILIESSSDAIDIAMQDDGTGFSFGGSYTLDELEILRLGPRSIKRRVRTLGGDLTLQSRPTQGAMLKIRIPSLNGH